MPETIPKYLVEAFVREQPTFDSFERFESYDAVSPVKDTLELEPIQGNSDLNEAVGTASYQGSTLSEKGVSFKGTFKLKPKDPADLDTDLHQYLDGAGTVVVKVYDVSDTVNGPIDDLATASGLDAFTANYQILPDAASEASGDGFLIGHDKQFSRIEFNDLATGNGSMATWNDDGGKYQYSTGEGTWADLTVADTTDKDEGDGLRTLQQAGTITFTIPEDWVRATYDGDTKFWIRYNITAAELTQTAVIDDTNKDEPFVIDVDQMGPDIRALIKAAMGWEQVVGITSVAYKLSDTNRPDGLQVQKHLEGYLQENGSGIVITEMVIKATQGEDPTFEFTGEGARYGRCVKDVIGTGGISTNATSCPLNNASIGCAVEPACYQIGDDDNSSEGYLVTAHDPTADAADFTLSPKLAGAGESAGEALLPFAPSRTEEGTVLAGINHSLTIDSVPLGFRELTVKVTTQYGLMKEATSDRAGGVLLAKEQSIEFEVSGYYKTSATGNAPIAGQAFDNPAHDIDFTLGDTSGARMKGSIPAGEGRVSKLDYGEVVMVTIKGKAKQASAASDEFALSFD